MPKTGYCTITIRNELLDAVKEYFENNKGYLADQGIHSVASFCSQAVTKFLAQVASISRWQR